MNSSSKTKLIIFFLAILTILYIWFFTNVETPHDNVMKNNNSTNFVAVGDISTNLESKETLENIYSYNPEIILFWVI